MEEHRNQNHFRIKLTGDREYLDVDVQFQNGPRLPYFCQFDYFQVNVPVHCLRECIFQGNKHKNDGKECSNCHIATISKFSEKYTRNKF